MKPTQYDATDAELAILRCLWDSSPATIRDLTGQIYPNNSDSDYATTKKLLFRLEEKQLVVRDRSESKHTYSPNVSRDDLVGRRLQKLADSLCEGSKGPLLMQLLGGGDVVSAKELGELKKLVQKLSKTSPAVSSKKKKKVTHVPIRILDGNPKQHCHLFSDRINRDLRKPLFASPCIGLLSLDSCPDQTGHANHRRSATDSGDMGWGWESCIVRTDEILGRL